MMGSWFDFNKSVTNTTQDCIWCGNGGTDAAAFSGRGRGKADDGGMQKKATSASGPDWPDWVPESARHYLAHTEGGEPIRALARSARVHASTILRQVRRFESLRDDPLVDDALRDLSRLVPRPAGERGTLPMTRASKDKKDRPRGSPPPSEARIAAEAPRVLRRLCEQGAVLAVARDMEMGIVVRDDGEGAPQRTAVVDRAIAQALALKDWIACKDPQARIARYRITALGRAELRRMMAEGQPGAAGPGLSEAPARFRGAEEAEDRLVRHMRSSLGDSPILLLARRRDRDGKPFLSRELIAAAERLREDFELSYTGPRVAQNWEAFVSAPLPGPGMARPPRAAVEARERVNAALRDLGPGLADVALRCCCFLEGLESLEERMGWSARSGKIVLRIALMRLARHYAETLGPFGPKIG
jgi:hypothetical protein